MVAAEASEADISKSWNMKLKLDHQIPLQTSKKTCLFLYLFLNLYKTL